MTGFRGELAMTARRARPVAGRAGWGLIDQAFSSLTNFALGIVIARTVPIAEFGAFSLAFAAYLIAVNMMRAFPMQPLAIRYSTVPVDAWRRGTAAALGTVFLVGIVAGVAFVLLGLIVRGAIGPAFVALGLTLPGLLLQDGWRSAFFAGGKGSKAFQNDLVWACILFPALGLIASTGNTTVFWLTFAWGCAGTFAAIVGVVQSGVRPRPLMARSWWREHHDLGPRFLTEAAIGTGASQIAWYGVGIVAGLAAVGATRAALLLFGPLQILSTGLGLMAVPEGVRAMNRSLRDLEQAALALSSALVVVAVGWCVLLLLVPESFGVWLLGSAWGAVVPLLVPLGVTFAGLLAMIGPMTVLRAVANSRRSLRANVLTSIVTLTLIIEGAWSAGALGACWGAALAAAIGTLAWWRQAVLGIRDRRRDDSSIAAVPRAAAALEPGQDG
jgi:O-antigen/teichoic acid export membrane protein